MVGADGVFQLVSEAELDPWAKSVLLARAIKEIGADLVLCGREALDTRHGQVGAFLAHHLGFPFVSSIKGIEISREGTTARVERSAGRGLREIMESPVPAVFSVDVGPHALPFPTYEEKKRAEALPLQILRFDERVVSKTKQVGIHPPRPRPKRIPTPESSLPAFERIRQLLSGSRIEKKGMILTGSPASQVEGLVSFLKEHAFLKPKNLPDEG
jgi:electron transfer flavoprotein beta subunit